MSLESIATEGFLTGSLELVATYGYLGQIEAEIEEPSGGGGGKGKDRQDNWRDIQRQKQHELILREDEELTMLIKTILTKGLI